VNTYKYPAPWLFDTRTEHGLVEHICNCSVGHPAWGSADWMALVFNEKRGSKNPFLIHTCCGCCNTDSWKLCSLKNSYSLIRRGVEKCHPECRSLLLEPKSFRDYHIAISSMNYCVRQWQTKSGMVIFDVNP
jgi:hypothetical protein